MWRKVEYQWTSRPTSDVVEFLVEGSYEYDNDYSINMQIVSNRDAINRQLSLSSPCGMEHLKKTKSLWSARRSQGGQYSHLGYTAHPSYGLFAISALKQTFTNRFQI
jgi:hypothetical protein